MSVGSTTFAEILTASDAAARAEAHRARMLRWIGPHLERKARGAKHPVHDFLFDYYPCRAAHLLRWHPGPGLIVAGAPGRELLRDPEYRETDGGVIADPARWPAHRRDFLRWLRDFLAATLERPAQFACFGLHEWAMVYRLTQEQVRHAALPLRLPPADIARVVETLPVCCTHYDAFRFFTPEARPLNRFQPRRETQAALDQPGCLHANMDLYKWALKLRPFTPGELLADCFELAWDIREVDMRASAYDTSALGLAPVPVETPAGREEYARMQRDFSARSHPLRARLRSLAELLLTA